MRLVPEAAAATPRVSRDGRTYTFTIRRGLRFNTGEAVTARTFVATINRNLRSRGEVTLPLGDIVGAEEVREGKAEQASGLRANGNRLMITLVEPAPDFQFRSTLAGFCAVPVGLPVDPEGVGAPFPPPARTTCRAGCAAAGSRSCETGATVADGRTMSPAT